MAVTVRAEGMAASSGLAAARFSNVRCAASGATATRVFHIAGRLPPPNVDAARLIQAAIDRASAAGGGIVRLPAGTFRINGHLILRNNVKLAGAGPATRLKAGPGFLAARSAYGGFPLITTSGARKVTIANLTADQSGNALNANTQPAARLAGYLIDVRDSVNAVVSGVRTRNPFTYSIAVVGSSDFCVIRCNTRVTSSGRYDQLDGIHVLDSHDGQVIRNYVDQRVGTDGDDGLVAHSMTGPVYDVLYADNWVRGGNGGSGMQLAVGKYPIYDVVIRDNNFWGSPYGIRTGYWATGARGTVNGVDIYGNHIHDLVPGGVFVAGGDAVGIGGSGQVGPISNVKVTENTICHAGNVRVVRGSGNLVKNNHFCR